MRALVAGFALVRVGPGAEQQMDDVFILVVERAN